MSSNQGIQFLNDGGCYEGEHKDGKYHGQGSETWSDGDKLRRRMEGWRKTWSRDIHFS